MKGVSIGKRAGGLLLAVLLAALATTALISYVNGLEGKAFAGAETVQVYVARDTIAAGTPIDAATAAITTTEIPRKVVAEGAVASLDQLRGMVAAVTILRGEQIVAARFVSPTDAGGGLVIPAGYQAMAVEVETPPGVAGFVQPAARVSVIAHLDSPAAKGSDKVEPRAQFLLQNVQVLAVGRSVATRASGDRDEKRETETVDRVLMTLAVTAAQAEKLAYAIFEGDVYFTLLAPDQKPVATSGRTRSSIFR